MLTPGSASPGAQLPAGSPSSHPTLTLGCCSGRSGLFHLSVPTFQQEGLPPSPVGAFQALRLAPSGVNHLQAEATTSPIRETSWWSVSLAWQPGWSRLASLCPSRWDPAPAWPGSHRQVISVSKACEARSPDGTLGARCSGRPGTRVGRVCQGPVPRWSVASK